MSLNIELIPFVGLDVPQYTPYDKYEDLSQTKTHYSLNSVHLESTFEPIRNFKELKDDAVFQQARDFMRKKELISVNQYNSICKKIAENMDLSTQEYDKNMKFVQELDKLAADGYKNKGKFKPR